MSAPLPGSPFAALSCSVIANPFSRFVVEKGSAGRDYADNPNPLTAWTRAFGLHFALSSPTHCARNAEFRITSTRSTSHSENR
jgi:hypothetical protein